jgi:hypothetical protein
MDWMRLDILEEEDDGGDFMMLDGRCIDPPRVLEWVQWVRRPFLFGTCLGVRRGV